MRTCAHPDCSLPLGRGNQSGLCRSHNRRAAMQANHADPEWSARNIERARETMTKMHQRSLGFLTPKQLDDYRILRSRGLYTRAEALAVLGVKEPQPPETGAK